MRNTKGEMFATEQDALTHRGRNLVITKRVNDVFAIPGPV